MFGERANGDFGLIFGLLLLALVTSKLIAIKQNVILSEIYEISFNERVNRLRSSFLLFRQDISRVIAKIEENSFPKREVYDLHTRVTPFEDALSETHFLLQRATKSSFVKSVDPLNTELLLNSVINSLEKINELMELLLEKRIDGKKDLMFTTLGRCTLIAESIFKNASTAKELETKKFADLDTRKQELLAALNTSLEKWNGS